MLPGFVDAHTHLVFAGERSDEFARKMSGETYLEIARSGGGILATVRATRSASEDDLFDLTMERVRRMVAHGSTTIEIKSGYGLDLDNELKCLRVARAVGDRGPASVLTTFLGAHTVPPEYQSDPDGYVDLLVAEMIPAVAPLADFCDVFVEEDAFTVAQARRIFAAAAEHGMEARVHAEQLGPGGGALLAAEIGAASADHLDYVTADTAAAMAAAGVTAVLTPGASHMLRSEMSPGKTLIEAGCEVAVATDCNPGTSYFESMAPVLSLATVRLGLTAEQAVRGATLGGARSLGLSDRGHVSIGARADLQVLDAPSALHLPLSAGDQSDGSGGQRRGDHLMTEVDRTRIASFMDQFVDIAAGATTIGLLAIADRSGLLRWMSSNPAGTSPEIAAGAGLEERYVREILSGLAAAGVVEYQPHEEIFKLPAEHALLVADESSPYFMGGWLDMIPSAMKHVDSIARAAIAGGGVAFENYGSEMIAAIGRGNTPSQTVFLTSRWLGAVAGLTESLAYGINVADIGCGTGAAARLMAEAYPRSRVTGYDASPESIALARQANADVSNVEFKLATAEELSAPERFDLVTTFDVVHDLVDPAQALSNIRASLRPEGWYLMMEPAASSHLENNLDPHGTLLYGISTMHCMTQSLAAGGAGLGAAWGEELAGEMARRAGFSSFEKLEQISNRFSNFFLLRP